MVNGTAELLRSVILSPAARVSTALPDISPVLTSAEIGVEASTVPFTAIAI